MKKQWIAEAAYLLGALVCIGVCVGGNQNREQEVFGTSVTATPEVSATKNPQETSEITSAPVKDTIPVPEDAEATKNPVSPEDNKEQEDVGIGPTKKPESVEPSGEPGEASGESTAAGRMPGAIEILNDEYEQYSNDKKAWWFRRNTNHKPSGSGEEFPIAEYSAYYLDKNVTDEDKVMYLTFDCGYENGFTPSILDTLAEKDVKAMFFVTKDFIVKNPEYVKRMKDE